MGTTLTLGNTAFRDYTIDNMPASGANPVIKREVRLFIADVDERFDAVDERFSDVLAAQGAGHILIAEHDDLDDNLDYAAGTVAEVYPDVLRATTYRQIASNVATLTTSGAHGYVVGEIVVVTGIGGSGYFGNFVVASVPSSTTFTYETSGADEPETADTSGLIHQRGIYYKELGVGLGQWVWNRNLTEEELDARIDAFESALAAETALRVTLGATVVSLSASLAQLNRKISSTAYRVIAAKESEGIEQPKAITSNYTLTSEDIRQFIEVNSGSTVTITIPADADEDIPIGSTIRLARLGAGVVTIAPAGGVTLTALGSLFHLSGVGAEGSLYKRAANAWRLSGSLN